MKKKKRNNKKKRRFVTDRCCAFGAVGQKKRRFVTDNVYDIGKVGKNKTTICYTSGSKHWSHEGGCGDATKALGF